MKVLDLGTGEEKGAGETGELCFQVPQVKIVAVLIEFDTNMVDRLCLGTSRLKRQQQRL